jgi:methylphosphotriester-DNA--protein-cysteine methyltransferase
MGKLNYQTMLKAFKECDKSFDGEFYVAVKSTGIYCLPSCKARLPLEKNITFYNSREEAADAGFRGCLRCRSEFYPNVNPEWLEKIKRYIDNSVDQKITEDQLVKKAGVDISTIRRYFKYQYHLTPISYHRKIRLQHARDLIKNGMNYITVAHETGFESVSGFRDAFYKEFLKTPGELVDSTGN